MNQNEELNLVTNKDILEKAVQKAIDGGFEAKLADGWVQSGNLHARTDGKAPYDIIFSHSFAQSLWGDTPLNFDNNNTLVAYEDRMYNEPIWQYHLQQMVINDNPIAYLRENI